MLVTVLPAFTHGVLVQRERVCENGGEGRIERGAKEKWSSSQDETCALD